MPNAAASLRRILLTADTVGGVWTYALELAHLLHQHEIQVLLATMGGSLTDYQRAEVRNISGLTLFESSFKLEWMEEPWSDVAQAGDWLLELAEVTRPDIVHLNSYVYGALHWRRPTLVVGHSCVLSWWAAVKGEVAPASWERYRRAVARGLHAADLVVTPTQAMLAELERHYGCFARSRVVPNGRNPARFSPADKQPFIFAVGRLWDEAKNVGMLDQVAPSLAWPVYVAGEERHPVGWQVRYRFVRELGQLSPPMLAHWLARAAIFALPARYEPFGLSVLEAGLAGCALVLGDIPSLREHWDGAALFIPPDNARALRTALNTLSQDGTRLTELAAQARTRALQFAPQRMLMGYLTAYREILDAPQECGGEHEKQPTSTGLSAVPLS
jgi:glycogen synthase